MAEPDLLFTVRNAFYLGAFQSAIAEASDLEGLSDQEKVERDCSTARTSSSGATRCAGHTSLHVWSHVWSFTSPASHAL
jgi:hypothetical protein